MSKKKSKTPKTPKKPTTLQRKEMDNTIDLATGLTHTQLKAAQLLAQGLSYAKVAKALGVHVNTIFNWRKKLTAFRNVQNSHTVQERKPLILAQLDAFNLGAVDKRFAQLLLPAIEALNSVLADPKASEMARVNAAKYVCTRIYERLTQDEKLKTENLDDLKNALKLIK
jgi:transposase-like protein